MKKVCYTVILQSQLGPRGGELLLQADSQTVSGELCLLGRRNRFSGSVLQSGKYLISGNLRVRADLEPYIEEGLLLVRRVLEAASIFGPDA